MVHPITFDPAEGPREIRTLSPRGAPKATAFAAELDSARQAISALKFSGHALERLSERGITLSESDIARLAQAVDEAAAKGARETLVLMDRSAFIVSVPNRVVITAVPSQDTENVVFTKIDSVVVVAPLDEAAPETKNNGLDPFGGGLSAADRSMRHILEGEF